MPSERIPEEIVREAREVAATWQGSLVELADEIARALIARDKRAAAVCRRIDDECGMEAGLAAACATAILTYGGGRDAE